MADQIPIQTEQPWKPAANPWLIAAAVMLATFMEVLDTSVANVSLNPSSTVCRIRLLQLHEGKSLLALHSGPDAVTGVPAKWVVSTPVARTACEACAVSWLLNRKRLPWSIGFDLLQRVQPTNELSHSHSRSACFMPLSSSCLRTKARKLQNTRPRMVSSGLW